MGKLYNLARMTTATAGTGTITLGAAVSGYLTFALAGVANGDVVSYGIKDGANSETGTGTYTTAGTTLTRTVTKSTNANAAISLSGTAEVFITPRAEDLITPALVRSYLAGLTLSTAGATSTFGVAVGVATDSTNADVITLASAYTKTTSAWAVGTGNGSLDTGAVAINTGYHAYLIKRPDTGIVDVLISLSATAPTLPTNYTLFRRLGWMKVDGTGAWTLFKQLGDEFLWSTPPQDINTSTLGTTAVSFALSTPAGIQTIAILAIAGVTSVQWAVAVSALDQADILPAVNGYASIQNGINQYASTIQNVRTDTSRQVRARSAVASTFLFGTTLGYIDRRGRDG